MKSLTIALLITIAVAAAIVVGLVALRLTNKPKFDAFIAWVRPRIGELLLGILASAGVAWALMEAERRQRADDLEDALDGRLADRNDFMRGELKAEASRVAEKERRLGVSLDASKQRESIALEAIENIKTPQELEASWRRYRNKRK